MPFVSPVRSVAVGVALAALLLLLTLAAGGPRGAARRVLHAARALRAAALPAAASLSAGVAPAHAAAAVGAPGAPPFAGAPTPDAAPVRARPLDLRVPLRITRFPGYRLRKAVVRTGIPLAEGALRPAELRHVFVTVRGERVPARVTALRALHGDGSLRSVLVELECDFGAAEWLPGVIGAHDDSVASAPAALGPAVPAWHAAALPSDSRYLVASGIVGPTRTVQDAAALGAVFARYDRDFATWADRHWASDSARWDATNYYDRALIYYAMWARTANPEYWRRAALQAVSYRRDYLEANRYAASAHWAQLEGLEKHYLLTGDEASRTAVIKVGDALWGHARGGKARDWDQRINARTLHGTLMAWQLQGTPEYFPTPWPARLDSLIGQLTSWQNPDGSYDTGDYWCHTQANYMVGLLNDALIKTYEAYRQDPRIVRTVQRSVDYLWRTQWRPDAGGFQYQNGVCANTGNTDVAADLDGLLVAPFAWLARVTGEARYRQYGDAVFAAMVDKAYLVGGKQFNQAYSASYRYLGYR